MNNGPRIYHVAAVLLRLISILNVIGDKWLKNVDIGAILGCKCSIQEGHTQNCETVHPVSELFFNYSGYKNLY